MFIYKNIQTLKEPKTFFLFDRRKGLYVIFHIELGRSRRLLVSCKPMREKKTAKLTINSVFVILNLILLFIVLSLKGSLSKITNFSVAHSNTCSFTRDVFYVRREVDLMKTAIVNAYIMHIFGKIELLSIHAT